MLQDWLPTISQFEEVTEEIYARFTTSRAADDALHGGDEVLAHSILFIWDSLFF